MSKRDLFRTSLTGTTASDGDPFPPIVMYRGNRGRARRFDGHGSDLGVEIVLEERYRARTSSPLQSPWFLISDYSCVSANADRARMQNPRRNAAPRLVVSRETPRHRVLPECFSTVPRANFLGEQPFRNLPLLRASLPPVFHGFLPLPSKPAPPWPDVCARNRNTASCRSLSSPTPFSPHRSQLPAPRSHFRSIDRR